ncbi:hypothetical protein [Erythrobacter colymbi]|uniref:hypothetical protein n=1 Tax=Erythrobacter colymbi TaxID=1161202 RepID=UPI0012DEFB78|nr:hypothetical protein [Erythrobacter colymbi]
MEIDVGQTFNQAKATYSKPNLSIYGGFADLTAAGSTGNVETGRSAQANMIRP